MMHIQRFLAVGVCSILFGFILGTTPAGAQTKDAKGVTSGKVTAVTQSELVVATGDRTMKFVINEGTDVLAKGATKTTKAAGGKTTITSFVHVGDSVSVTHRDAGGAMIASQVRVTTLK
jgi:hypothetical protein